MSELVAALAAIAIIVCAVPLSASAQGAPTLYLYVNDFIGVLTSEEISTLDEICFELDEYNSDEIALVIVNTTQPMGIDTYAFETFRAKGRF